MKIRLEARGFSCTLDYQATHSSMVDDLAFFLSPFFRQVAGKGSDLAISLHLPEMFPHDATVACTEPLVIRKSSSPDFNLVSASCERDGKLLAWNPDEHIGYVIDRKSGHVDLFCRANAFYHLIELIRYFGLRVLEARGALILHSSSVVDAGGNAIAIVGQKGAGKSTTMIRLIERDGYAFLSGDKLVVRINDGKLTAAGWPDFPHIGLRSLQQHPKLFESLRKDLSNCRQTPSTDKVLIPPAVFRRHFPIVEGIEFPLTKVVLPAVQASGALAVEAMTEADKNTFSRSSVVEEASKFATGTWHGLEVPGDQASGSQDRVWRTILELPWERWQGSSR